MHLKPNKIEVVNIYDFSGNISTKENSIIALTKIVVALSILLAVLMVVSK